MVKNFKFVFIMFFAIMAYESYGQVTINIDNKVEDKLRMKNARLDSTRINGYRIQIAFSSNRNEATAAEAKFRRLFPEYASRTYKLYQQPYWKVRVCNFYREIDAQPILRDIRNYFPKAIIVTSRIRRPKIK